MGEDFDDATMDAVLIASASAPSTTKWPYGTLVAWLADGYKRLADLLRERSTKKRPPTRS